MPRIQETMRGKAAQQLGVPSEPRTRTYLKQKRGPAGRLQQPRRENGRLHRATALRLNSQKLRTGAQFAAKVSTARRRERRLIEALFEVVGVNINR